jgi:hypothetical protein
MTLVAADLLVPNGRVDGPRFYPDLVDADINTRLTAYIAQGYTLATGVSDDAVRAYVYYLVWSDVVNMLTLDPASVSLGGEVSNSRLQTQIDEWIAQRNAWRTQYLALLPVDPTAPTLIVPGTQAVRIIPSF